MQKGRKVLIFGNGGSASQAQHFAAELIEKFVFDRKAIPAIALTTDSSIITAVGNDRSFEDIFSRQIEALGKKNDIAIGLSTSGQSVNVINGLNEALKLGMFTIALTGSKGILLKRTPDALFDFASHSTARIQEAHLFLLHLMAEEIEKAFLSE